MSNILAPAPDEALCPECRRLRQSIRRLNVRVQAAESAALKYGKAKERLATLRAQNTALLEALEAEERAQGLDLESQRTAATVTSSPNVRHAQIEHGNAFDAFKAARAHADTLRKSAIAAARGLKK